MRHDDSGIAMIEGLYQMSWRCIEHCTALATLLTEHEDMRSPIDEVQNTMRITKQMYNLTIKQTNRQMKECAIHIENHNEGVPQPVVSTIVGIGKKGACEECVQKPPIPPDLSGDPIRVATNMIWGLYSLHEQYRQHQLHRLRKTKCFDKSPDGLRAEVIYKSCGGVIQTGLDCLGKPVGAYQTHILGRGVDRTIIDTQLSLNRFLPKVVDIMHDVDWCKKCEKHVVRWEEDIYELL